MNSEYADSFEARVLSKCEYFSDIALWPTYEKLNPNDWLCNFLPDEKPYALKLLNFFYYFSERLVNALFFQTIHALSNFYRLKYGILDVGWIHHKPLYITVVPGESPNVADSGHLFTRKIRDLLSLKDSSLLYYQELITKDLSDCNLIFVDDFVGSGSQICTCLNRTLPKGISLMTYLLKRNVTPIYCNTICTSYGLENIRRLIPDLKIVSAHVIGNEYSVFSLNSLCWDGEEQQHGVEMIRKVSERAGISMTDGDVDSWNGFHKLGLALAFSHSIPDATLPIFTHDQNGWKPLIRK